MSLAIQIYDSPSMGQMLADYTRFWPPVFSTGKHGFAACEISVPMSLKDAFAVLDWPGVPHVVVSDERTAVLWEGRLEKATLINGGVRLTAFGYWQALADVRYTGLWSAAGVAEWDKVTTDMMTARQPQKYAMDNNNRLYVGLRKGEAYTTAADVGAWFYYLPDGGEREPVTFTCSYAFKAPTGFKFQITSFLGFSLPSYTVENDINGTGALLTGSLSLALEAGKTAIHAYVFNNSGSTYTNTTETGNFYLTLTNVRLTTVSGDVIASDIAAAMVARTNGINSGQLSAATSLIEATTDDLLNELYEDEKPSEILDRLAELSGYEVGVWENRLLHFRPKGSQGRTWFIDATRITDVSKDLGVVYNEVYATYQDENRRTLRTAVSQNSLHQETTGIVRQTVLKARTTSQAQAESQRDTHLDDQDNYAIVATVEFDRIFDESGAEVNQVNLRSGDTAVIRNLPPTLGAVVDLIREFKIAGTSFDGRAMRLEPELPAPTLVTLIARKEAVS